MCVCVCVEGDPYIQVCMCMNDMVHERICTTSVHVAGRACAHVCVPAWFSCFEYTRRLSLIG